MITYKEQLILNKNLQQGSEIIISYINENGSVEIINRMYIRYLYSKYKPYHFFVIAKEKATNLKDGTICTINSLNIREFTFRTKLSRICYSNFEKVCDELIKLYQYNSPKTSFEIFEAIGM